MVTLPVPISAAVVPLGAVTPAVAQDPDAMYATDAPETGCPVDVRTRTVVNVVVGAAVSSVEPTNAAPEHVPVVSALVRPTLRLTPM